MTSLEDPFATLLAKEQEQGAPATGGEAAQRDRAAARVDLGLSPSTEEDIVDLLAVGEELMTKARAGVTGRAVRAVVRQSGQMLILLAMPAGGGLPDHDAPGPASLQCLSGQAVLVAGDRSWSLRPGSAVMIPQERHEVRALTDSLCVLAVSLPV
ncbi:MAG: hypothetical protein Q4P07_02590 [Ornithinimicrobium sp.]|uniref:hypothetical protein n=1 Tax=Ornithinimicrobium sp. TaxID=1977084 RepID=UPI0026E01736|nr:hypothetical protein [Ornithinimicrobium sp.]MDO5739016.1 hypothetical protein [Ornithinimicrobium sp.]